MTKQTSQANDCALDNARQEKVPGKNSTSPALNLLRYWRNCLVDIDRLGLSHREMSHGKRFATEIFEKNQIPQQEIEPFFIEADKARKTQRHRKNSKKRQTEEESQRFTTLQVIIAPYTAVKKREHGEKTYYDQNSSTIHPLWIMATLNRDNGQLSAKEDALLPWIERNCLTPNEATIGYPIIGDVNQVDTFYAKNRQRDSDSDELTWEILYDIANQLFQAIAGENSADIFATQHYAPRRFHEH
ncbi:MAG: hypothetical protein GY821_16715 [Gammaproteobacteria bacterium]|nr:hypothetical protein [Gammaproteobacteria bacterium]